MDLRKFGLVSSSAVNFLTQFFGFSEVLAFRIDKERRLRDCVRLTGEIMKRVF